MAAAVCPVFDGFSDSTTYPKGVVLDLYLEVDPSVATISSTSIKINKIVFANFDIVAHTVIIRIPGGATVLHFAAAAGVTIVLPGFTGPSGGLEAVLVDLAVISNPLLSVTHVT